MKHEIINFLEHMTNTTNTKITGVESIPIIYWGETYVSGFKMDDSGNVMVQFKVVKRVDLTSLPQDRCDYYMMNPDAEFWLPYEFLDEVTIDEVFKELADKINEMKGFDILHAEFNDKTTKKHVVEGIIFPNKRLACKEAMNYRKTKLDFSFKLLQAGEKTKPEQQKHFSAFEFATAAL